MYDYDFCVKTINNPGLSTFKCTDPVMAPTDALSTARPGLGHSGRDIIIEGVRYRRGCVRSDSSGVGCML